MVERARASIQTARTYTNPTFEFRAGHQTARPIATPGVPGLLQQYAVEQPIEIPAERRARIRVARLDLKGNEHQLAGVRLSVVAEVKRAFYNVLRRKEQVGYAKDNLALVGDLQRRVRVEVQTGEKGKLELTRADAEVARARAAVNSAEVELTNARSVLKAVMGTPLEENFEPQGGFGSQVQLASLKELRQQVLASHPALAEANARTSQTHANVEHERALRLPQTRFYGEYERQPDLSLFRLGVNVPLPLWDKREGPIAEATAEVNRAEAAARQRKLQLMAALDRAYDEYQIRDQQVAKEMPASSAKPDPLKVQVPAALLQSISIGTPQLQDIVTEQKVAARVETDASRLARIGSPVDGRITEVRVFEGQTVVKGQVLAMLHSNALSDTQFAFIKAFSREKLAEQAAARARLLVQSDVIGTAELQKREAEVLQTSTEVAALRAQLRGLGMSDQSIYQLEKQRKLNSDYPIVASISGTVIERKVTVGQVVQPGGEAFLVADLSSLWLVADVPEEHSASLYLGKTVVATVPALPGIKVKGSLSFVSPVVDPQTRTVRARMNLVNAQGTFKPDMLASMTFESRPHKGLTLPATAVVREESKDHVFVEVGTNEFRLREVELDGEVANRRAVVNGVSAQEKIVLDGAFHLNNKRKQDQLRGVLSAQSHRGRSSSAPDHCCGISDPAGLRH